VAWSPDSRLLLVGGQDDLVILYSVDQRKALAKAEGHRYACVISVISCVYARVRMYVLCMRWCLFVCLFAFSVLFFCVCCVVVFLFVCFLFV
jgi:hypothetical protein